MSDWKEAVDLAATNSINPSMLESILGADAFRLTPATYAAKVSGGRWIPAKHLLYISAQIAYGIAKGNARIIVSMPPRHGKSELLSVWTPIWTFDRWPDKQIISLSYGADLAEEFSQKSRDIILEDFSEEGLHLINPKAQIRQDSQRVNRYLNVSGGGLRATGVGGSVYGRGADLLLLDDYYKNVEEARSPAKRESVLNWFTNVAMTRLLPGGSVIILATRWDVNDLSAELLKLTGSRWTEICLPAEAYQPEEFPRHIPNYKDPLGRAPGEVLWPEKYPKERLDEFRDTMGSFSYSSIYQQNPKLADSNVFKRSWVRSLDVLPHRSRLKFIRSWDLAGSPGKGDYTVGVKMAIDIETNNVIICDVVRVRLSSGQVEKLVEDTAELDGFDCSIIIEQEPGSSGKASSERYQKKLAQFAIVTQRNTGDKFTRAEPFLAAAETGRVYMLKAGWNEDYLDEWVNFPSESAEAHDDQCDATSQAYNRLFSKKPVSGSWGRNTELATQAHRVMNTGQLITGVTWGKR